MPSDLSESRVREIMECWGRTIDMRPVSRREIVELCKCYLAAHEPPDVETIKRAAVREFAEKLLSFQRKVRVGAEYFQVVLVSGIRAACTARGANLEDKP